MRISKVPDVGSFKEANDAISDMVDRHFLNSDHAKILQQANQDDPDLARWFISTIHHHTESGKALSDDEFAGLCLMGMHRYDAHKGVMKNAPDHPHIQNIFEQFNAVTNAPNNKDIGLLMAVRNYLTRTPQEVGLVFVRRLEESLKRVGKTWSDLKDDASEYFRLRAETEKEYIARPDHQSERQAIKDILANLPKGLTLNDLLRSSAAKKPNPPREPEAP